MKHHEGPAAPESGLDIPDFATLAGDPEIAPLLNFEPVARKVKRPDGWTPELQRELIARIAVTGTLQSAVWQMGKHATGAEALYKTPGADSFRESWDAAVIIGRRRNGLDSQRPFAGPVPGITRRIPRTSAPQEVELEELEAEGPDDDRKLQLVQHLAGKLMKKVALERQLRLNGEIVAADFTLRQVTMIEIVFDLTASHFGWDAREVMRNLRRGERSLLEIVSTPFADWLDVQRRIWWLSEGDPERPPHPDPRFIEEQKHGPWGPRGEEGYTTYVNDNATGAMTNPARGYSQEEWRHMNHDEQRMARQVQFDVDSEEQREWERRAHEDWEARQQAALSSSSRT